MEKKPRTKGRVPGFPTAGEAAAKGEKAAGRDKALSRPRASSQAKAADEGHGQAAGHHGRFATAINCMDGRVQLPVIDWMKDNLSVDYVDMITEPGPDKLMAEGNAAAVDSIKARVLISVNKHGSDTILMVSHGDCAGNPVTPAKHTEHLRQSISLIQSWRLPVKRILGAWIGDDWKVRITIEEASR